MAYDIAHFDGGVIAPNVDYPYGDLKDNSGIGDGTLFNKKPFSDVLQLEQRLLAIWSAATSIPINNLPDNETNGFQAYDALIHTIDVEALALIAATGVSSAWSNTGITIYSPFSDAGGSYYNIAFKIVGNICNLCGIAQTLSTPITAPSNANVLQLPPACYPSKDVILPLRCTNWGGSDNVYLQINTSGRMTINLNTMATTSIGYINLDSISYRLS